MDRRAVGGRATSRRGGVRVAVAEWPPVMRELVRAAETECPRGHAEALVDLTTLALRKVPARGVFDPSAQDEHELFAEIEKVGRARFELADAEAAWRQAIKAAALPLERRDALERAAVQVQTASDTSYFYAGLAFGLVFVCVYRSS
jgi:hypothetical protein